MNLWPIHVVESVTFLQLAYNSNDSLMALLWFFAKIYSFPANLMDINHTHAVL